MNIKLYDVIDYLRPNSEFVMSDEDILTLIFHTNHTIPTEEEIERGKNELLQKKQQEAEAIEQKKNEVLNRLGITQEEAKLLLS